MNPISTHIQEILTFVYEELCGTTKELTPYRKAVIRDAKTKLLEAIKSRDSYCLGEEEENLPIDDWARTDEEIRDIYSKRKIRDNKRLEIQKRQEETL